MLRLITKTDIYADQQKYNRNEIDIAKFIGFPFQSFSFRFRYRKSHWQIQQLIQMMMMMK